MVDLKVQTLQDVFENIFWDFKFRSNRINVNSFPKFAQHLMNSIISGLYRMKINLYKIIDWQINHICKRTLMHIVEIMYSKYTLHPLFNTIKSVCLLFVKYWTNNYSQLLWTNSNSHWPVHWVDKILVFKMNILMKK